ncbi:hypothetical protein AOLI_G00107620 [Acnodon oligacanthus]
MPRCVETAGFSFAIIPSTLLPSKQGNKSFQDAGLDLKDERLRRHMLTGGWALWARLYVGHVRHFTRDRQLRNGCKGYLSVRIRSQNG